jgi:hypothetical protein
VFPGAEAYGVDVTVDSDALEEPPALADEAGVPLRERLPAYARYLPEDRRGTSFHGEPAPGRWLSDRVRTAVASDDEPGRRLRAITRGEVSPPRTSASDDEDRVIVRDECRVSHALSILSFTKRWLL